MNKKNNTKILCIDIEGGHGGSSRSLYYAIEAMDKNNLEIVVVSRLKSWIKEAYQSVGIKNIVEPNIPRFTVLKKSRSNLLQLMLFFLYIWPKSYFFRRRLIKKISKYHLIHLNHASLFILAKWIKKHIPDIKITMHIRTMPYKNIFSKIQANSIINNCNSLVFITENELNHMQNLVNNKKITGKIIFNPVKISSNKYTNYYKVPTDKRIKIAVLSNYSFMRGIDRVVDIMNEIPKSMKKNILFIVAGDMNIKDRIPNDKFNLKKVKSLQEYISINNLDHYFLFLGSINFPEKLLPYIDLLIKPTRENNPWGRDILEAMAFGKPVISIGKYKKFVETDITGLLIEKYEPKIISNWIIDIINNKNKLDYLKKQSFNRVNAYCNSEIIAKEMKDYWSNCIKK